ncbi:MAG TPA: SynChlorMet cassette protein ScmC [Nitrospirae bacterium]|nr:hypothetical protein BMS3Abin06_00893 [bacterium BMS3Abin06]HDH13545.1 SynChlorMet cassette protein ScmC [Nitrospirota bacterium]HDZ01015.1 SynChlorMet cassette protein ScmC [Nitrospirota bacterium]
MMTKPAYMLKLGNGSGRLIKSTLDTISWVEKFAAIMELKANGRDRRSNCPGIFFVRRGAGKDGFPEIDENFPESGWKSHDFRALRFWSHRTVSDIICEIGDECSHELDIVRMWTSLYIIYLQMMDSGGLPVHAALIEIDGKGILIAGPGGSGKSTLCRRLPRSWHALSDDQSLIVRDDRKGYLAHPIPTWSDYLWQQSERRWNVERCAPLTAIFFIEQAESEEAVPIGQGQAAVFINRSSTEVCRPIWRNLNAEEEGEIKKKIFDNACKLARAVPAYILRLSRDGRFRDEIEKVL